MSVEGVLWEGWPEATAVGQTPLCFFFTAEAERSLLEADFMVSMPEVKASSGRSLVLSGSVSRRSCYCGLKSLSHKELVSESPLNHSMTSADVGYFAGPEGKDDAHECPRSQRPLTERPRL